MQDIVDRVTRAFEQTYVLSDALKSMVREEISETVASMIADQTRRIEDRGAKPDGRDA